MRRAAPALLLLAWLMATGAIGTCDYFKPTQPELPANLEPVIPDYSNPTHTLETIARGIEDKSQTNGQQVYMDALAETTLTGDVRERGFRAFFDAKDDRDDSQWDSNINSWDREDEPRLYSGLVQEYSYNYEMTWAPYRDAGNEDGGLNDSLVHRQYRIEAVIRNATTGAITRLPVAVGRASLNFVRSTRAPTNWVIATWSDFRITGPDTITIGKRRLENKSF